ncbi:hypothetical protein [Burkholderia gladioli]|uniref:hypothetical protein n=1 Tax=Burkholderia gladioli TaxID=28095 RepID=UPI0020308FE9|nr:hypothetical protein [Burkholderia gladioli]URV24864.1 hypothetical protein NAL90_18640 [Burkholderia gladioli]
MADTNSISVLTHKSFARSPVENRPHRGSFPKSVVRLENVRSSRREDEAALRAWAIENGNASWSLDRIRQEKRLSDAKGLLEQRNDDAWQMIKQLKTDLVALIYETSRLECLLVERQIGELSHE